MGELDIDLESIKPIEFSQDSVFGEKTELCVIVPVTRKDLETLSNTKSSVNIRLKPNSELSYHHADEYYEGCFRIIKKLSEHNQVYNIKIELLNRQLLREKHLLENIPSNVKITLCDNHEVVDVEYSIEEFLKEEKRLDDLVKDIKESNLSPLERYIAVYNIAKRFKPYLEETTNNGNESRSLKYILDNEYIVCTGFAVLLAQLLDRVDIPNTILSVLVDDSYNNGFTQEEKSIEMEGHNRNLVKIEDDKYNVHGYYLSDSTWDNDMDKDYYLNALMTFNRKKENLDMESVHFDELISNHIDSLLDFNSMEEFDQKINDHFRKIFPLSETKYLQNLEQSYEDYRKILEKINNLLVQIGLNQEVFYETFKKEIENLEEQYGKLSKPKDKKIVLQKINQQIVQLIKECDNNYPLTNDEYLDYTIPYNQNSHTIFSSIENIDKFNEIKDQIEKIEKKHNMSPILETYRIIFEEILNMVYSVDKKKFTEFYEKYNKKLYDLINRSTHSKITEIEENNLSKQIEQLMNEFIDDYANYILPLTNKEVSLETLLQAASIVKKEINGYTEDEIEEWHSKTLEENREREKRLYPYQYIPGNQTEYLDVKENTTESLEKIKAMLLELKTNGKIEETLKEKIIERIHYLDLLHISEFENLLATEIICELNDIIEMEKGTNTVESQFKNLVQKIDTIIKIMNLRGKKAETELLIPCEQLETIKKYYENSQELENDWYKIEDMIDEILKIVSTTSDAHLLVERIQNLFNKQDTSCYDILHKIDKSSMNKSI